MEYTAQNLEYAVSVFYNGEQEDRAKAHAWLTAAQRVSEAWTFVWDLLQPSKGTEIQFYAATTLHTKILRCWSEVPPEMYPQLKEKLLQSVIGYSKGPKIVTNRLCISLAAFILQQGSEDLADTLRPLSAAENTSLLLEVLTVIPEEYNSMTMGTTLRQKNRAALNQASKMVLDDMLRYLQSVYNDYSKDPPTDDVIQSWTIAATCAASWLTLGEEDAVDCATTLPERTPLYRALLAAVHVICRWNEAVSDSALEACEACLSAVRASGTAGGAGRHGDAARDLLASVSELATPLFNANNVPNSINEELLSALITCCVSISECHSREIVRAVESPAERDRGARSMLELLLAAQAAPGHYPLHETRSNLVFGIWYTLQDEILNSNVEINPVWREVFTQLLLTLVKKSEMPPESALSKDDQELLRCYRQDIADIVMYCFMFLGESCWALVESAYTGGAAGAGGADGAPGSPATGASNRPAQREAALHVCLALADAAGQAAAPASLLHCALHCVADLNEDVRVLHTALDCLGAYAAWLSERPAGLQALAREAVRAAGCALPRCPAPAALALRRLCCDCSAPAAELVVDIVRVAQAQCASTGLDAWSRRQLLSAAGAALAASAPERATPLLRDLAYTLRQKLVTQIGEGGAVCAAEAVALMGALAARPDLAAALLRALQPALVLMLATARMPQPVFQVLKHTVSAMMGDILTIIEDISDLIVAGFEIEPCPVGLEVIKLVTVLVGSEWSGACRLVRAGVLSSARAVSPPSPPSAPSPSTSPSCAAPDLAEALFTLLVALTKKQAQSIDWLEDLLPDLVDLACGCVRVWEARAAGAACAWLAALAQRRAGALQRCAPNLTHTALSCIGGATPRNQMEPLAELLLALNRAQWGGGAAGAGGGAGEGGAGGEFGAWLREALARAGFPSAHATDAHKQKFIQAVLKEKKSKRRLLESVQEFSLACRGLIGTEYARQSLASKQMVA